MAKFWRPGEAPVPAPNDSDAEPTPRPRRAGPTLQRAYDGQPRPLIYEYREEFLSKLETNQVIILSADTGTGKTTQVPQFLTQAGWAQRGYSIAIALPRRIAVLAATARIAQDRRIPPREIGGSEVGYCLRFETRRSAHTQIIFYTIGTLLSTLKQDPFLSAYSVIVIDDVHERSISIDILLGLLRLILQARPSLRIVLCTALSDTQQYFKYFESIAKCHVIHVQGRQHAVSVRYVAEPVPDYVDAASTACLALHEQWLKHPDHSDNQDILIFVPGVAEVDLVCKTLYEKVPDSKPHAGTKRKRRHGLQVAPLHAGLDISAQLSALMPASSGSQKVIVATNIAESSLTIESIQYVIDTGMQRDVIFSSDTNTSMLKTLPISKQAAEQRKGRAGRVRSGQCLRLYTKHAYDSMMPDHTTPEILKGDVTDVVLALAALGVSNVLAFNLLVAPPVEDLAAAYSRLHALGVVREDGTLTKSVGTLVADAPLPATMARALVAGEASGVGHQVASVCAMIEVSRLVFVDRRRFKGRQLFAAAEGDAITFLNVFRRYVNAGRSPRWCKKHGISPVAMEKAYKTCQVLRRSMRRARVDPDALARDAGASLASRVCRALVAGWHANAATVEPDGETYTVVQTGETARIHPESVLHGRAPSWIIAAETAHTTSKLLRCVAVIQPSWLAQDVPELFQDASAPLSESQDR